MTKVIAFGNYQKGKQGSEILAGAALSMKS